MYKLINDNQIGADTIHNLIVSGSVTVREFQKNVDPVIFEGFKDAIYKAVNAQVYKTGHAVTKTKDRNIFKGQVNKF